METYGAVFARVRDGDVAALEAAIREVRGARRELGPLGVLAFDPAHHAFAVVDRWGPSDDLPDWVEDDVEGAEHLAALSRLCGEVVAEYSIETEDCRFAHWRDGELARSIEWRGDAWSALRGEAQAWEAALFGPDWLAASLDVAGYRRPDPALEAEVRAAFAAGRLVEGSRWPTLITASVSVSAALRASLRLPIYGFSPWPRRREVVKALPA